MFHLELKILILRPQLKTYECEKTCIFLKLFLSFVELKWHDQQKLTELESFLEMYKRVFQILSVGIKVIIEYLWVIFNTFSGDYCGFFKGYFKYVSCSQHIPWNVALFWKTYGHWPKLLCLSKCFHQFSSVLDILRLTLLWCKFFFPPPRER